ncbi:facilitated trehalose transporter Tret1-2 homolog [Homalodisca vitripennis]|uniref:facilitated trehalose transporter Tret1-2 homolog n=1 Tax=Homalodisca vitripennis TaxID=197043 RepID=UPI001EEB24DA|nr:facilitated trehalose transporter Tret1-2 homolog [Homalodisca vitripennis]
MAGPLISGALVDRLGRKGTVALNMGFMTGSCLLLTATRDVMLLSVGRFMSGVSWGISFSSIPLYIAEISEDSVRGVLNTALIISVATGSLFMYAVGPFVSYAVLHYILVGLCIFFFFLFPLLPNSPYALVMNNQTVRARDTLSWLRENRSPSYVENELQAIQMAKCRETQKSQGMTTLGLEHRRQSTQTAHGEEGLKVDWMWKQNPLHRE